MESFPELTTEAECRELLGRYPDNIFVKFRLAKLLRSQGRDEEATELFPRLSQGRDEEAAEGLPPKPSRSLKYDMGILMNCERVRQPPNDPAVFPDPDRQAKSAYQDTSGPRTLDIAPSLFDCERRGANHGHNQRPHGRRRHPLGRAQDKCRKGDYHQHSSNREPDSRQLHLWNLVGTK